MPLVVLVAWLAFRGPARAARRALAGAAGACAVVLVPFFALAPSAMVDDVLGFQLGRSRAAADYGERAYHFSGSLLAVDRLPSPVWLLLGALGLILVAVPLYAAVRAARSPHRWPEPAWWSVLALSQLLVLIAAPSSYGHYTSFAAPALCLLAGYGLHAALARGTARTARLLTIAGAVLIATLTLGTLRVVDLGARQPAALAAAVAEEECVSARSPAVLISAGVAGRQAAAECTFTVDAYAALQSELPTPDEAMVESAPSADAYQARIAAQFRGSSAVLITAAELTMLSPATRAVLTEGFTRTETIGEFELWQTRTPAK